jgi:hypothetical protein
MASAPFEPSELVIDAPLRRVTSEMIVTQRIALMITPITKSRAREEHSACMGSLHWTGATTVLVIRTLVVGPGR